MQAVTLDHPTLETAHVLHQCLLIFVTESADAIVEDLVELR